MENKAALFLVNVALGVLAYWLMQRFIRLEEPPQRVPLDILGMGLMAGWITCYALGLSWIETDCLVNM
ncbi:hypothetical protein GCM10011383_22690 [Hymenobacter cavernae]|uniref:Uncharacterized protein n=1 Tax=Hymenobacter cavernae TaxID=2044852 RepID=A0ABQ1U4Z6_9BACT|nr:hypothetical protein GCM10011383_22690 [Hymenobacter cavernae]